MSVDVERYSYRLPLSEQNGLDAPSPHSHKVEEAADYRPGLHHPTHLGEYIGTRRQYRVLTKIAVGRNSLVWLCRNVREKPVQYVAIKIRHARLSHGNTRDGEREMTRRLQNLAKDDPLIAKYCLLPIDEFEIQGPNGTHQCLVYPAAGPQLLEINRNVKGDPVKFLRKLAYQAVEAMAALHRHGICHRDFGPHKLLLRQDSLTGKSKRKVFKYLEDGVRMKIRVVSAQEGCGLPRSHAPEYLVRPIQYDELGEDDEPKRTKFTSSNICLIDFGESFTLPNQPPSGEVSGGYCAPEMLLESSSKAGMASDIWSLAYTIYEIRTGVRLSHGESPHVEDHLVPMVEKLGPLPEPWWSTTWKTRRAHFKDELDADGMAIRAKNIRGDLGNEVVNEGDDSDYYSDEDNSSEDDSDEDDSGEDDDDEDDDDEDRCYISDDGDSETDVEESDSDGNDENDFVFCTKEDFLTSGSGGDDSDIGKPVNDGSSNEHKLGSPVKNLSPLQWTLDFSGVRHFLRRSDGKLCHGKVSGVEEYLLVDLLSKMLKYDPNERPTAEQVLKHPWFSFRMKKRER